MNKFITIDPGVEYAEPTRICLVCECKENPDVNVVDTSKAWLCDTCRTALKKVVKTTVESMTVKKTPRSPAGTVYICVHHDTQNMEAIFDNRPDAEECLHQMNRICTWYGVVTEADLYDLCAITCVSGATDRGWVTTEAMSIVQEKDDYILRLPKPMPLR